MVNVKWYHHHHALNVHVLSFYLKMCGVMLLDAYKLTFWTHDIYELWPKSVLYFPFFLIISEGTIICKANLFKQFATGKWQYFIIKTSFRSQNSPKMAITYRYHPHVFDLISYTRFMDDLLLLFNFKLHLKLVI